MLQLQRAKTQTGLLPRWNVDVAHPQRLQVARQ